MWLHKFPLCLGHLEQGMKWTVYSRWTLSDIQLALKEGKLWVGSDYNVLWLPVGKCLSLVILICSIMSMCLLCYIWYTWKYQLIFKSRRGKTLLSAPKYPPFVALLMLLMRNNFVILRTCSNFPFFFFFFIIVYFLKQYELWYPLYQWPNNEDSHSDTWIYMYAKSFQNFLSFIILENCFGGSVADSVQGTRPVFEASLGILSKKITFVEML